MDSLVCGLPSNMWLPCPEYIHLNNELLSVLDIVNGVPSIYGCHDGLWNLSSGWLAIQYVAAMP